MTCVAVCVVQGRSPFLVGPGGCGSYNPSDLHRLSWFWAVDRGGVVDMFFPEGLWFMAWLLSRQPLISCFPLICCCSGDVWLAAVLGTPHGNKQADG